MSKPLDEFRKKGRACKVCIKEDNAKYYQSTKQERVERVKRDKEYYQANKIKRKQYLSQNVDKVKSYRKTYRKKNKDKINAYWKEYKRNRIANDPLYRLSESIRNNLYCAITRNGYTKRSRTHEILGCSFNEFKLHIESKWADWMNWDNYGKYNGEYGFGWDIDHSIPISSAKSEDEILELNHHTNLQPLCSKVNRDEKKAKILK